MNLAHPLQVRPFKGILPSENLPYIIEGSGGCFSLDTLLVFFYTGTLLQAVSPHERAHQEILFCLCTVSLPH